LSAIKIFIEPLRNRPEDIPYLIDYYIRKYKAEYNTKNLKAPRQKTIDRLCAYGWPGNVRELQNMLKRLMILGDAEENINGLLGGASPAEEPAGPRPDTVDPAPPRLFDSRELSDLSTLSLKKMRKKAMDQVEREVISYVLEKTGWNRSKATKLLKISYKTLLYKIKDLGIQPPPDAFD
jgi:DNA-binding NtrC family response regulator